MSSYHAAVFEEFGVDIQAVSLKETLLKTATFLYLFCEQILTMAKKFIGQKRRIGRSFLKETFLIPFFILLFVGFIFSNIISSTIPPKNTVYQKHGLPPLSKTGQWGIFNPISNGNMGASGLIAFDLYYSPNNHIGISNMMKALSKLYPDVTIIGASDASEIQLLYEENLFNTLGSVQFNLTDDQVLSGELVTSEILPSMVEYTILINPMVQALPVNNEDFVLNDFPCLADTWWSSGYLTIQNFIATYLAKQYLNVPSDYEVTAISVTLASVCKRQGNVDSFLM